MRQPSQLPAMLEELGWRPAGKLDNWREHAVQKPDVSVCIARTPHRYRREIVVVPGTHSLPLNKATMRLVTARLPEKLEAQLRRDGDGWKLDIWWFGPNRRTHVFTHWNPYPELVAGRGNEELTRLESAARMGWRP